MRRLAASALDKLAEIVTAKAAVAALLPLLRDEHPQVRQYAAKAIGAFGAAIEIHERQVVHCCQRCGVELQHDELLQSQKAFQRAFCNYCFDEVFLERRNFETKVELQKKIRSKDGTWVQSDGERRICEVLDAAGIKYRYDERFRILDGYAIRPDFYLQELLLAKLEKLKLPNAQRF